MPEFRQNFLTKDWVIIAPERAKRPDQFKKATAKKELPERDPTCPFCTGNEDKTPPAVFEVKENGSWQTRVVPNKFAAVNPSVKPVRKRVGRYMTAGGFGIAEVVVESPKHNLTLGQMGLSDIRRVLGVYKQRYIEISKNPDIDLITIFRNNGAAAGTSLEHPHSQIIAAPIITQRIRSTHFSAIRFHDTNGACPHCAMLEDELKLKERVVMETSHFVALCPFASPFPFEVLIIPKGHTSHFSDINDAELDDMAKILGTILNKFYNGLDNPDYNYVIESAANSENHTRYNHWRLNIVPRLTTPAGFEIGSGIFINTMPPEMAAKYIREFKGEE